MFTKNIDTEFFKNYYASTTSHELAHQFDIDNNSPCSGDHDYGAPDTCYNAWCGEIGGPCANLSLLTTRCLMSGMSDPDQFNHDIDEYNRLECEDLGLEISPINCLNQDCGLGLRTQIDPQ